MKGSMLGRVRLLPNRLVGDGQGIRSRIRENSDALESRLQKSHDFGYGRSALNSVGADAGGIRYVAQESGGLRPPLAGRARRRGLTLFEVLISLVIFVGAMAAIGQLVSNGVRGALQARFQSQAALMCESKLGEVVAGIVPLVTAQAVYPDDSSWSWSLIVTAAQVPGLMRVEVTVKRQAANSKAQVAFTMARYVRDPQLYHAAQEEADRIAQEKADAEAKSDTP